MIVQPVFQTLVGAMILLLGSAAFSPGDAQQGPAPRVFGPEHEGWFCPWCEESNGMGFSMTPRGQDEGPGTVPRGPGMGPGKIEGRRSRGPGLGSELRSPENRGNGEFMGETRATELAPPPGITLPLTRTGAQSLLKEYLKDKPGLSLVSLKDAGEVFAAEVENTQKGIVDRLLIDKGTGWFRRTY